MKKKILITLTLVMLAMGIKAKKAEISFIDSDSLGIIAMFTTFAKEPAHTDNIAKFAQHHFQDNAALFGHFKTLDSVSALMRATDLEAEICAKIQPSDCVHIANYLESFGKTYIDLVCSIADRSTEAKLDHLKTMQESFTTTKLNDKDMEIDFFKYLQKFPSSCDAVFEKTRTNLLEYITTKIAELEKTLPEQPKAETLPAPTDNPEVSQK